jgi:hypothetical protein
MIPDILETRQRLEAKIEELIALLDLVDDDPDLEDTFDDEPSIGTCIFINGQMVADVEMSNGDETDYSGEEGDHSVGRFNGGSGL